MNNNHTVIHSKDPWLLARLSTDLIMEGIKDDRGWNDDSHPFDNIFKMCMQLGDNDGFAFYTARNICLDGFGLNLTTRNYLQVLTTIIERHGK